MDFFSYRQLSWVCTNLLFFFKVKNIFCIMRVAKKTLVLRYQVEIDFYIPSSFRSQKCCTAGIVLFYYFIIFCFFKVNNWVFGFPIKFIDQYFLPFSASLVDSFRIPYFSHSLYILFHKVLQFDLVTLLFGHFSLVQKHDGEFYFRVARFSTFFLHVGRVSLAYKTISLTKTSCRLSAFQSVW